MKNVMTIVVGCLLLLGLPANAQLKKKTQPQPQQPPLTQIQKKQVEIYRKINQLSSQGKHDPKLFFNAFYTPIKDNCAELADLNLEKESKMDEYIKKAHEAGNETQAATYIEAQLLFKQGAEILQNVEQAIKAEKLIGTIKGIDQYIAIEKQLKAKKIKPVPRQWFTIKEAEAASYRKKE